MAEEDEGVADEDQRVAVASNHRHSTYIITSYLSAFSDFVQPCQIIPIIGLYSAYGDGVRR
jgi:hypothetical protein